MTEAYFLLNDAKKRRTQEMQTYGQANAPGGSQQPIGMMNMNDDVIRKTNAYLTRFVQFKDVEVSKEIRKAARDHGIDIEICIHI